MVTMTKKQKYLYAFSAIFSLILILTGRDRVMDFIGGPNKDKVQVSLLLKEFSAIPIHRNDTWSQGPESFDKSVITGVTLNASSSASQEELISYYLHILPPLGWKLLSRDSRVEGQKLKFCKNGVSLILDFSARDSGVNYYLGLVWTKYPQSSAYCEMSPASP